MPVRIPLWLAPSCRYRRWLKLTGDYNPPAMLSQAGAVVRAYRLPFGILWPVIVHVPQHEIDAFDFDYRCYLADLNQEGDYL